jgi:hypothetical protein
MCGKPRHLDAALNDARLGLLQRYGNTPGTSMFEDVVQRLLRDSIQRLLDKARQAVYSLNDKLCLQVGASFDGFQAGTQRRYQSFLIQDRRAQLEDEQAHLCQRLLVCVLHLAAILGNCRMIA